VTRRAGRGVKPSAPAVRGKAAAAAFLPVKLDGEIVTVRWQEQWLPLPREILPAIIEQLTDVRDFFRMEAQVAPRRRLRVSRLCPECAETTMPRAGDSSRGARI
jgi:hypothetical protein